ncbi:MAG: tRNA cyclic N6-threonylcarbamoyladenosine(37) synthase TcdA [Desulfobacteraceae bacterium 4572_35.1]|nr:MAG: tRNA cyclic N6-threonylcarbamoyladenosine(37) synthase TcdA [Desulfobacteraceae bacterium 4572_35.1]
MSQPHTRPHLQSDAPPRSLSSSLQEHRFGRTELIIGSDGIEYLQNCHIAVLGAGGVGGYAIEALTRAGIGQLTLIDNDTFSLTNINRQLHATDDTIGRVKVDVVAQRCRLINPRVQINTIVQRYSEDNAATILQPDFDYVLDCIDTISAKIDLIQRCTDRQLPIISSMGSGNKLDPTKVVIADLFHSQNCRLARILRKELRRRGVTSGVPVVYSTELYRQPRQNTPTKPRVSGENWQQPPLGSISTIPALFGLMMAGKVIQQFTEKFNDTL